MANKKEQGFNDAELQDIMSEIENLEREYDDETPESKEASAPVVEEEVVTEIETTTTEHKEDNIVSFKPKAKAVTSGEGHQVDFQASGQMDFAMNFEIAGQTAHLEVTENGLVVSLDGMHLSVNEEEGCTVEMDGGVKFSVPMKSKAKSSKAA